MILEPEELSLIRDALDKFIVGVPRLDEMREALIEMIDAELAKEE